MLEENLLPSIQQLGLGMTFVFMHNNDPKHTSALVKYWLRNNGIQVMQWPSSSSDPNPIEHLWNVLEDQVKKHHSKKQDRISTTSYGGMEHN